jgi:hypothetical protein
MLTNFGRAIEESGSLGLLSSLGSLGLLSLLGSKTRCSVKRVLAQQEKGQRLKDQGKDGRKNKGRKDSGRILDKAALGGAGTSYDRGYCLEEDFEIEPQGPIINIIHRGGSS